MSQTDRYLGSLLAAAALLAACGTGNEQGAGGGQGAGGAKLTGAGATFPNPIYTKWFDAYAKQSGIRINYQSIGSGGGIRQFLQGTVDFGATDGPMSDEDVAKATEGVLHVPTVIGAVVLTYNLPELGDQPLKLDAAAVADIFLGKLTRWDDPRLAALNPGLPLPAKDIIVVHRSDGSGTTYVFVDYLAKVSPEWARQVGRATSVNWPIGLGGKGNEGVTQQVKQTEGALGYVEQVYASANRLKSAQVRNRAGNFVTAELKNMTAAAASVSVDGTEYRVSITDAPGPEAYPITSYTWLLVRTKDPKAERAADLRQFLVWMLAPDAQRMAADLGYAPLPMPLIESLQKSVASLGASS